jgi:hypothetical protein
MGKCWMQLRYVDNEWKIQKVKNNWRYGNLSHIFRGFEKNSSKNYHCFLAHGLHLSPRCWEVMAFKLDRASWFWLRTDFKFIPYTEIIHRVDEWKNHFIVTWLQSKC